MDENKKRKGYKTQEQQNEANKRYLAKNPEFKVKQRYSNYKSVTKKFILEIGTKEDLQEFSKMLEKRLKIL